MLAYCTCLGLFLLSQKSYANFCYKPSGLFLFDFFDDLQLQIIESISPKASRELISPVGYFLMVWVQSTCQNFLFVSSALFF